MKGAMRIAFVTTTPSMVQAFLSDLLRLLNQEYQVTLLLNVSDTNELTSLPSAIEIVPLPIERNVHLWTDLLTLARLTCIFRQRCFSVVHTIGPKAGLLGMIASWLARTPARIHTFQGEVWATKIGIWRWILKTADKITARCASHVLVVSDSGRRFLDSEGVLGGKGAMILANGSICGVDPVRFRPDSEARREMRKQQQCDDDDVMFLFVGRVVKDKGIADLFMAFKKLASSQANVRLCIVGPDEENILPSLLDMYRDVSERIRCYAFTGVPERFMAAADVICLPSYREGFGMVLIEAASVGLPSIASRIHGVQDAVEEGVTGLLHRAGDVEQLYACMARLARDEILRARFAEAGRARAIHLFHRDQVLDAYRMFYRRVTTIDAGAAVSS